MILVDAHVHIHECFDLQIFLDSALSNFRAEAARRVQKDSFSALLLLTESANINWFELLKTYADQNRRIGIENGGWIFDRTNEDCSLWARHRDGHAICLVAGRQIVTRESMEVLPLITDGQFADGQPIAEVFQAVRDQGSLAVIPWGFGKWFGPRWKILKNTVKDLNGPGFFLGDNGGRPAFWPNPSLFYLAERRGFRVLPGSDPLPFASEFWRPGSFGIAAEGSITSDEPAKAIKGIPLDPSSRFDMYGTLERPHRFFRNQLKMQIDKRLRTRKILRS